MNGLSMKFERFDFKELLDNVSNKAYWSKKHRIFEYDNIIVEVEMSSIDVRSNKVNLFVIVHDVKNENRDGNSFDVQMEQEHFNLKVFEKRLFNTTCEGISWIERPLIRKTKSYHEVDKKKIEEHKRLSYNAVNLFNRIIKSSYISNQFILRLRREFTSLYINKLSKATYAENYLREAKFSILGNVVKTLAHQLSINDSPYLKLVEENYGSKKFLSLVGDDEDGR